MGGACIVLQEGVRSTLIDGNTCLDSDDVDGAGKLLQPAMQHSEGRMNLYASTSQFDGATA